MRLRIERNGSPEAVEVSAAAGDRVLDVLQRAGVPVRAACGGAGTCGKCQVLVRDGQGVRHVLACREPVRDGMLVVVEDAAALQAVEHGAPGGQRFAPDDGACGLGMAVDIGTTTLAAHLHDLATGARLASASCPNPQISYGGDVISRISASMNGKLPQMTELIQDALRALRDRLLEAAGRDGQPLARCTVAGNTVMQHIAAGLSPDSIGVNPFTPLSLFGDERALPGLGTVYFAPCMAGYVGGDISAGLLARGFDDGRTRLFLDLGTNGEMALSHADGIVSCATAAGPVFEGANIQFGMPAAPGAIRAVGVDDEGQLRVDVIGDAPAVGICGTGIVDAVALLVRAGIVDDTGYLLGPDEAEGPLAAFAGVQDGSNVFFLTPDRSVFVTQADVRNLQLAKAAVCAGIRTMLDYRGLSVDDVQEVQIAGGFGQFLDVKSAAGIGLIPPELAGRAVAVGNTSAEGASGMLVSAAARARAQRIARDCDYLELSTSAAFNGFYVDEMEF